jgi:hypothetical protein
VVGEIEPAGSAAVLDADKGEGRLEQGRRSPTAGGAAAQRLEPAPRPSDVAGELEIVGECNAARWDDVRQLQGRETGRTVPAVDAGEHEVGVFTGQRSFA